MKIIFTLLLAMLTVFSFAQTNLWEDVAKSDLPTMDSPEKELNLRHARSLQLKFIEMRNLLAKAPLENTAAAKRQPLQLELPMPDGSMQAFEVVESPTMEPGLAAKFPDIQSFKVVHTINKTITGRLDISPVNFHAMIDWNGRSVFIDPAVWTNGTFYHAYFEDEVSPTELLPCGVTTSEHELPGVAPTEDQIQSRDANGAALDLRTFRIAIATTGEFSQKFGGTVNSVMSAINTAVNRTNQVYERDLAIRLILINNNERLISLDPATDPYTNADEGLKLVSQQFEVFANVFRISFQEYDLGHLFTGRCSDVGGVALGGVCSTGRAQGVTCFSGNNVEATAIGTFAHEVGHQFSASHTFGNNCNRLVGAVANAGSPGTAFEPECGISIMSYGDIPFSYFHSFSIQQMLTYYRTGAGSGCASIVQVQNNEPELTLNYSNGFYIPIETPFELKASATDADSDALTYSWEQLDADAALFPITIPSTNPKRVFPALNSILNEAVAPDGMLPDTTRDLTFRCLVRDNHPQAGASVWKDVKFKATKDAGPFAITYPNDDTVQWTGGTYVEVRWNVANTDKALVNCKTVNILLSTDGGATFPIVLAQQVPNTGVAKVAIPEVTTNRARVRVEAADNIFFDINNRNFQIWPATQAGFTLNAAPRTIPQQCLPDQLQFTVQTDDILGFNAPLTLSLEGSLPGDAVVTFSKNPVLPSESSTLTIQFKTQVEGTFNLQLKATSTNNVSQTIPISFNTISNDFSQLIPLQPINGASNIGLLTTFVWKKSPYANTYDFELATSPTFGNTVVASVNNLQDTSYVPTQIQFDENRLYFWRIRPANECGKGAFLEPSVFRTAAIQCAETASTNVPVNISGSGLPTVNSTIAIPTQGTINDVNIPLIKANYQPVKSLRISLISPAGTEVILYDQKCGNTLKFETGFDDEAPTEIVCPPDDKLVVRPNQPLSAFKGQNTAGTWTLRTKVVTAGFGGGGAIEGWNIEFCSTLSPNNPSLLKNDTLKVPPGKTNTYTRAQLEVTDTDNTPLQLTYLLVTLPQHGTLARGGAPLQVGSTFTQAEINNFQLQYTHNGDAAIFDSFLFVVEDGTGGWLPTQRANIQIDPNATVDVNDLLNKNVVLVFPNPTRDLLNVQFNTLPKGSVVLSLFNAQGQEVQRQHFDNATPTMQLNTNTLASGVYFLTVRSMEGMVTKKVMVQR